ncbi:MAG TPA: AAA family ATPase, partial [Steroidobacteraceae bacterium]|nr:AAA family ATPase [Steroidobacteraceae bacterium]
MASPDSTESQLLERSELLAKLRQLAEQARGGSGSVALITGEAGVGKSSLANAFLAEIDHGRVGRGGCEALFTPRPLGPLHDIARELRGDLLRVLIDEAPRPRIFATLLDILDSEPIVLLIEDVHWADEATLDMLKFLGRRIGATRALLLVTYRDDAVGPQHPLRSVLGDLPASVTHRIPVAPLSRAAVERRAERANRHDPRIYERTGGNPFYVTELLATPDALPASVRDAVFARAQRLSADAQRALEATSIVPGRVEQWL